jgi:hypothetical protein
MEDLHERRIIGSKLLPRLILAFQLLEARQDVGGLFLVRPEFALDRLFFEFSDPFQQ